MTILEFFKPIIDPIVQLIGRIHWRQTRGISEQDKQTIMEMLKKDYYVILTRRSNHLSTFFISLSNFVLTGRWSYYSHALMNLEDEVQSPDDFRLIEAVGHGTKYSTFDEVFDGINGVALLRPKSMTTDEWTAVMDRAKTELGKPYDTLFDLANDKALSCVELVRVALMALPTYFVDFANFEAMISRNKNLTPQMYRDCSDFEPVLEIKK